MIEYLVEWVVGGEHFRNYRQFMEEGALLGFLAHISPERIRWQPVFHGSMALASYRPGDPFPSVAGKRGAEGEKAESSIAPRAVGAGFKPAPTFEKGRTGMISGKVFSKR
jgi:hypothetical protein